MTTPQLPRRRAGWIAGTVGALLVLTAAPAWANWTANDGHNACALLTTPSYDPAGNTMYSQAETNSCSGSTITTKVQQNRETKHFYGWTTNTTSTDGPANRNTGAYIRFGCGGGTYKYYSRHYHLSMTSQWVTLQTYEFSC